MLRLTWLSVSSSYSHSSTVLPRLHALCAGIDAVHWEAVRATIHDHAEEVTHRLWKTSPDVIAATVYLFNRVAVLDTVERIALLAPQCRVILGGPEWLGQNEAFLRTHPAVDAVFRGEGEAGLPRYLQLVRSPQSWDQVPGLCWIDASGAYRDNGRARTPGPLDALPAPMESAFFDESKPFAQLETSRGCPFHCTFCTSADTGPIRHFSIERVRREIEACRKKGIRDIRFLDRTFNAEPRRTVAFLELFREQFPDLHFHLEWRPVPLSPPLAAALEAAPRGQLHLEVGLQTTHPMARKAAGRDESPERAVAATRALCELRNLRIHVDLLAGLPNQTLESLFDDAHRVCKLAPAEIQIEVLKVLPGTPLWSDATRLSLLFAHAPPYDVLRTPQLAPDALATARRLSVLVDRFYNAPELQPGVRAASQADSTFFPTFLEYAGDARLLAPQHLENRFRLLHGFSESRHLDAAREALEFQWLRKGLSPTHGIARAELWRGPIPADAVVIEGDLSALTPGSRAWRYQGCNAEFWFVFAAGGRRRSATVIHRRCVGGFPPPSGNAV